MSIADSKTDAPQAAQRGRRVTSTDVARAAGVSQATVSYVLNAGSGQTISESTRERVIRAAADLGYTPSEPARALRSGRSNLVLALLPDWPIGSVMDRMLSELASQLKRRGLILLIHRSASPSQRSAVWRAVHPTGVIVYDALSPEELTELRGAGVHIGMAVLDPELAGEGIITLPQQRIGDTQVDYLVTRGHRRLGYAMPADRRVSAYATQRLAAVRAACRRYGLRPPSVRVTELTVDSCARAVKAWASLKDPVTAVCAYNDEVAIPLLTAASNLGRPVPEDLALVGVDDIPLAAAVNPSLTTVAIDPRVLAQSVAELLASGQRGPHHDIDTAVRLVVRASA